MKPTKNRGERMEQVNYTTKAVKYKHLTERDRYRLEGYLESGLTVKQAAQKLNSHISTIYREIKRGQVKGYIVT